MITKWLKPKKIEITNTDNGLPASACSVCNFSSPSTCNDSQISYY